MSNVKYTTDPRTGSLKITNGRYTVSVSLPPDETGLNELALKIRSGVSNVWARDSDQYVLGMATSATKQGFCPKLEGE